MVYHQSNLKYSTHNDKLYLSFGNVSHHHQTFLIQHLKPLPPSQGPITNIKETSKTSDNQNFEAEQMIQLFKVIESSSSSCKSQAPWASNKLTYTWSYFQFDIIGEVAFIHEKWAVFPKNKHRQREPILRHRCRYTWGKKELL